jgi:hypothetical protein
MRGHKLCMLLGLQRTVAYPLPEPAQAKPPSPLVRLPVRSALCCHRCAASRPVSDGAPQTATPTIVVHWLTLLLRVREIPGSILDPGDRLSWLRFLVAFLSPSSRMQGQYLKIRTRPLPTKSFPIHHHSFIILSSTLYSLVTEKLSLNKQPTNPVRSDMKTREVSEMVQ